MCRASSDSSWSDGRELVGALGVDRPQDEAQRDGVHPRGEQSASTARGPRPGRRSRSGPRRGRCVRDDEVRDGVEIVGDLRADAVAVGTRRRATAVA